VKSLHLSWRNQQASAGSSAEAPELVFGQISGERWGEDVALQPVGRNLEEEEEEEHGEEEEEEEHGEHEEDEEHGEHEEDEEVEELPG